MMILSFSIGDLQFQLQGTLDEHIQFLTRLQTKPVIVNDTKPASNQTVKIKKFDKPIMAHRSQAQYDYISALFTYPMSNKSATGKPAYMMALMLDCKPHTVEQLCKLGNCTPATIKTVVNRLRASGSTVEMSSNRYAKNTIIQITKLTSRKFTPAKRKASSRTATSREFKNLAI